MSVSQSSDFRNIPCDEETLDALKAFNQIKDFKTDKDIQQENRHLKSFFKEKTILKTKNELKSDEKKCNYGIIQIIFGLFGLLCCFVIVVSLKATYNDLTKQYDKQEQILANKQAQTISLESEIGQNLSLANINDYAIDNLGMIYNKNGYVYINVDDFKQQYQEKINNSEVQDNE